MSTRSVTQRLSAEFTLNHERQQRRDQLFGVSVHSGGGLYAHRLLVRHRIAVIRRRWLGHIRSAAGGIDNTAAQR